ncbi:hypothetical protein SRHO_G00189180 [Serrasalmus rhombeus]
MQLKSIQSTCAELDGWLKSVDKSRLPRKFKAWVYHHDVPRILWPLLIYAVPISAVQTLERKVSNHLRSRSLSRAELSEVASQRRIERRSGVLDQSDPGGRVEVAALCSARSLRRSRALFKPSDRYELLTVTRSQHQQQRVYRLYSPVKPPPNGRYRLYGAARDPETFFSSTHTKTRIFQQRRIKWSPSRDYRTSGGRISFKRWAVMK